MNILVIGSGGREHALAWVISHAGACAIAGARNTDQAVQNAGAATVSLSNE